MVHSVTPTLGVDLDQVYTAVDIASGAVNAPHALGQQVWGDDGQLYVFAQANAAITASGSSRTVSPTTFLVTATGGAYDSPATAMVTGDRGWFAKPSV